MSTLSDRKKIDAMLDEYRTRLDLYTDERFAATPAEGVWSYAEVYSHILQATYQSLLAVERACGKNAQFHASGTPWYVRLILLLGVLPPGRYKAPEYLNQTTVKMTREEARNMIIRIRKKLDALMPGVRGFDKAMRVKHPRLGMLHAGQWLRFTYIHLRHHIAQLDRISKMPAPETAAAAAR